MTAHLIARLTVTAPPDIHAPARKRKGRGAGCSSEGERVRCGTYVPGASWDPKFSGLGVDLEIFRFQVCKPET